MWPVAFKRPGLEEFLRFPTKPLSAKATLGFLNRLHKGQLRLPNGFLSAIEAHLRAQGVEPPTRPTREQRASNAAVQRERKRAAAKKSTAARRKSVSLLNTSLLFES